MKKIFTIIGARPQFIKASVVSAAIEKEPALEEVVAHTGQHFDSNMSDIFFDELGIKRPDYNLNIHGGGHGEMTGRMLEALERTMKAVNPDLVLVYGDTNSTLAGALSAAKIHIPVAHVEAGLRSFNMRMPEEINRRLTDHISTLLFTPNHGGLVNLQREGIVGANIQNVGDVMYDAALHFYDRARLESKALEMLELSEKGYILATIHRQENTDVPERLENIIKAFSEINQTVVFPVHPRTKQKLANQGLSFSRNVRVVEPLGYLDMVMLEKNARAIVTDSGGVQKEAYFHRVPCITLRDETEWTELIELGWNRLASPSSNQLVDVLLNLPGPGALGAAPYGDGNASEKITESILKFLR